MQMEMGASGRLQRDLYGELDRENKPSLEVTSKLHGRGNRIGR